MATYTHRQESKVSKKVVLSIVLVSVFGIASVAIIFFYQLQSETVGDLVDTPTTQMPSLELEDDDFAAAFDDSFFESASDPDAFKAQAINDEQRRQDIDTIHQSLQLYFTEFGRYPDLNDMNSAARRAEIFTDLEEEVFIDPDDTTGKSDLTRTPQKSVYAYWPVDDAGNTCEPVSRTCTAYELAATLSDGFVYRQQSP